MVPCSSFLQFLLHPRSGTTENRLSLPIVISAAPTFMWKPIDIKDVVYRGYGGAAGPVDLRLARTVVERRPKSPSRLQPGENTIEQKLR